MKKILSIILALSMLSSSMVSAATVDGLIYKNSSGEKTVDMKPGNMTVEANVTGDSNDTTAHLISAVYNEDEDLIGVGISPQTNITSKTETITTTFNVDTMDGAVVKNFIWKDIQGIYPLTSVQSVLIDLEVTEKPGYQVLNWSTTADSTGHTYKVLKDGAVLAQGLTADKHAYVDKTQGSGASNYQVKAVKNGAEIGASNIVSSAPVDLAPVAAPSTVSGTQEWTLDPTVIRTVNDYAYTNAQLKVVEDASSLMQ